MTRMRIALVAVTVTALLASAAWAQTTVNIAAFYGKWSGSAISESNISVNFQLTARDMDVELRPAGAGFTVIWTTVLRQRGNPNAPTAERRSTELSFEPTSRPNVWRAVGSNDPLVDERFAWARLTKQTLTIHTLVIRDDGGYDMQIYDRALKPTGMELEFTAFRDGEERRTAKGRLVKVAN
ncbi:MAG: hypothetical protein HQ495_09225 [Alphaproteobacteria bacterium]|nr:hypothetical protein [Alphaproteobacteria bacterium]